MARGTKTYTTGKVRSIRTGTIIHTYSNVNPAGTFQTGDNIFQLQYFPPEANSPDCVDPDNTPDAITFTPATNSEVSTVYTSNPVTISGLGIGNTAPVSIIGGEWRKNGAGSWSTGTTTAQNTDTFEVRRTSSASYSTAVSTTLTVGGVSGTYTITSKSGTPSAFVFTDLTGANINTVSTSNTVTMAGYVTSLPISVVGGEYSINGGAFTSAAGSVAVGSTVAVRRTSSGSYVTPVDAVLTVGTYSDTYTVTTKVAPAVTVNYSFTKDGDPTVDIVLVPVKNGISIGNIYGSSSGVFASTFAGNTMDMYLVHQITYMPWPTGSSAYLIIEKDNVEIYNSGVITNVTQEQIGLHSWTLEEGSVYDIISVSNSDSTAYISQTINWDDQTGQALGNVMYEFEDADQPSEPFIMHTTQPVQPLNNVGINWATGPGLGRLDITINDSGLALDINLSNTTFGGGYTQTITVPISGTGFFANLPKTSYLITVTEYSGEAL